MESSYVLTVLDDEPRTAKSREFGELVALMQPIFQEMIEMWGVPDLLVETVLADDFDAAVNDAMQLADGGPPETLYHSTRLGGVVLGKNIALREDWSHVRVVFNSARINLDTIEDKITAIFFIAHELSHPITGRLEYASGALSPRSARSRTPRELARDVFRVALDEWRADRVAGSLLSQLATVTEDGKTRPARLPDVHGAMYTERLGTVLDDVVFPGWPDAVESVLAADLDVEVMWERIFSQTKELATLMAHSQAEVEFAERPDLIFEAYGQHKGIVLYLGAPWVRFREESQRVSIVPSISDFKAQETAFLDVMENEVLLMWERLGITFADKNAAPYGLAIYPPLREFDPRPERR